MQIHEINHCDVASKTFPCTEEYINSINEDIKDKNIVIENYYNHAVVAIRKIEGTNMGEFSISINPVNPSVGALLAVEQLLEGKCVACVVGGGYLRDLANEIASILI